MIFENISLTINEPNILLQHKWCMWWFAFFDVSRCHVECCTRANYPLFFFCHFFLVKKYTKPSVDFFFLPFVVSLSAAISCCVWISLCHHLSSTGYMHTLNEWYGSCIPHHSSMCVTVYNSIKPVFSAYWPRTKTLKPFVLN